MPGIERKVTAGKRGWDMKRWCVFLRRSG